PPDRTRETVRVTFVSFFRFPAWLVLSLGAVAIPAFAAPSHEIYVTNEVSGDLTIVNGDTLKVEATVPLGKRPRGVEVTRGGKSLFVALSGSPIEGPPPPGGQRKTKDGGDDDEKKAPADKAADGIGLFDIATRKLVRIIRGVSDPEKLAVTAD